MKKRLAAFLCALAVLAGLLLVSATGEDEPIHLAINDTMPDFSYSLMPIEIGGTIYLPYTLFDQRNTNGISLGVSYGRDLANGTLSLYGWSGTLVFDLNNGTTYDQTTGAQKSYQATTRNGRIYVPGYAVCQFFGLEYVYLTTNYGPLVRIKSERVYLSDTTFVNSASTILLENLKAYQRSLGSTASPTGGGQSTATPTPTAGSPGEVRVCLGVRVEEGMRLGEMLDTLDAQGVSALFFFAPDALAAHDDLIRRMLGSGHQVGLLLRADVDRPPAEEIAMGSRLLAAIGRTGTRFLLVEGAESLRAELSEQGYLCWEGNVDGRADGRTAAAFTAAILRDVATRRGLARVTLDDTVTVTAALPGLLRQFREEGYAIRPTVETQL